MISNTATTPGSPPQVRGKPTLTATATAKTGITPAGAGKTNFAGATLWDAKDHPRRCGENTFEGAVLSDATGSPPQVRGKHDSHNVNCGRYGITPAGAGKTVPTHCAYLASLGSPPQVRGKLYATEGVPLKYRITPAGAGKTRKSLRFQRCTRDHPRRCGENFVASTSIT